jgi:hypothetical protein
MKRPYVEIAAFEAWAEADIFRNRLAAQGVPAVLMGPNTSSTFGMYMGVASKVSVMVPEASARLAEQILRGEVSPGVVPPGTRPRSDPPHTPIRSTSRVCRKNSAKR